MKSHIIGIQAQYAKGKDVEEIATFEGVDQNRAWAIILDGQQDNYNYNKLLASVVYCFMVT
jgi:hypothetical protein